MQGFEIPDQDDFLPVKISSPTCEDLGIPRDCEDICVPIIQTRIIQNPSLHIDGIRYEAAVKGTLPKPDPFSPLCMIPIPSPFTLDHLEPTFVRKRNERERERVRCVNDGYLRLKEQLPLENKNKRLSKVETLRRAIEYIRYLQSLLAEDDTDVTSCSMQTTCESVSIKSDLVNLSETLDSELIRKHEVDDKLKDASCTTVPNIMEKCIKIEENISTCCLKRKVTDVEAEQNFLKRKCVQNA